MFSYQVEYNHPKKSGGLCSKLSAEWDTRRDAAQAAYQSEDLTRAEFDTLLAGGRVTRSGRNGFEIELGEVQPATAETQK